ncbi:MAG TPA: response regulator [Gemmatimonadaceae bacterium]
MVSQRVSEWSERFQLLPGAAAWFNHPASARAGNARIAAAFRLSRPSCNQYQSLIDARSERRDPAVVINRRLVTLVDDDESVRESLPGLLRHFGFDTQTFPSAEAFLECEAVGATSCLILDVGLPGLNGPDLHQELLCKGHRIPTIFITAQCDQSLEARLIAQGAIACLFKPFGDTDLFNALTAAMRGSDDVVGPKR